MNKTCGFSINAKDRCRAPHSSLLTSGTKPSEAAPRLPFLLLLRRTFYLLSGCDWCGNALASGGSLLLQIDSGAEWNQGGADVEISCSQRLVCSPPAAEEVAAEDLEQGMLWQAAALFSSKLTAVRSGTKAALMWRSPGHSSLSVLLRQPKRWRLRTWNKVVVLGEVKN
ncbi:hypothetical protein Droror1_Dr00025861 [Drosera rotundifolia]